MASRKEKSSITEVPPHKHCKVCGAIIPPDKEYCSSKCEKVDVDRRKSYETYRMWLFVTLAMMLILAVINIVLIGLGR